MKKLNILYIVIFIVIVLAVIWAFLSAGIITQNFNKNIINNQNQTDSKEVNIEGLYVTDTKEGLKSWELFADTGHYDNSENIIFLTDIIGNFYDKGEVVVSFKAKRGTYTTEDKHINLHEDVVFVHKDGANIKADRITWKGKEEDITAIGNVRVEKPGEVIIYGQEAVLKPELDDFKINGRTKTLFYL